MPKPESPPKRAILLQTGSDPELWEYDSLQDAIAANVGLLGQLMLPPEKRRQLHKPQLEDKPDSPPGEVAA
ncbi:MAG: hypothetical protein IT323_12630 [Anaerolineae bacterium]|nr:hypothetical protein [Anaerolineae bacterium]